MTPNLQNYNYRLKGFPARLRCCVMLLVMSFCLQGASAQERKISLSMENATVERILDRIEQASDYTFLYSGREVDVKRRTDLKVTDKTVEETLNLLFAGTDTGFRIVDKQIILSRKQQSTAMPRTEATTQITGQVKDKNGEPVVGASVIDKEKGTGVTTGRDGKFTITARADAILQVSFLGYRTQDIEAGGRSVINIVMEDESLAMDEIVVVGYGTQSKKTLVGSVSIVDIKDIETSSKSTLSQSLQGKAAGLRVTQTSAQAGGGASFRIRGEASPNTDNSPLIVVDGIPLSSHGVLSSGNIYGAGSTDNLLESINPDDIESITVLKDAASTAIYGAQAGHGVILITTKRGEKNQNRITYSGNVTVQTVAKNYDMLSPSDYMRFRNKYKYEGYLATNGLDIYSDYVRSPSQIPEYVPDFTEAQIIDANANGTDWIKEVSRLAVLHQHNISLSGGTDQTRYLISGNFMDQKGIIKNNNARRFTLRSNLDRDIGKYVTAGLTAMYSQNQYDNSPLSDGEYQNAGLLRSAATFNPTLPVFDTNGEYTIDPERPTSSNPVGFLEITDKTVKDRIMGSAYIAIKPVEGLEIRYQLGADRRFQKRSNYLPKTIYEGKAKNGEAHISKSDNMDYLMDLTATYSRAFGEHSMKILGGYSFQKFSSESNHMGNSDFMVDGYLYHNIGAGEAVRPSVSSSSQKSSIASYFGRVNYSYANRYLFEATVRADGASNFTRENRWGYFPSVAVGWFLSEEPFMQPARKWLSMLKFRGSYGETGNYKIGYHIDDFFETYNPSYLLGGQAVAGVRASDLGNKNITWETTSEMNFGLDLGFLNNRITLTAEYFNREIRDLLSWQSLMTYFEVSSIVANIGRTQSKGYEITVNTVNLDKRDFGWSSTLTLAHYRDRWKERSPYWKPEAYQKYNDYLRSVYSYEALGLMKPGDTPPLHQSDLLPGMVVLKNQNEGDPYDAYGNETGLNYVLGPEDMVFQGTQDPNIVFGLNNTFRYKNFSLNIYFYGETGLTKSASYMERWAVYGGLSQSSYSNLTSYAFRGYAHDNLTSAYPSILSTTNWGNFYTRNIYFIRCGNIRLGYDLPVKNKVFRNIHAYINVDNPFVITNWNGLDPETDNMSFSYPNLRAFTVGISITL